LDGLVGVAVERFLERGLRGLELFARVGVLLLPGCRTVGPLLERVDSCLSFAGLFSCPRQDSNLRPSD
jgi:hypothetical protein